MGIQQQQRVDVDDLQGAIEGASDDTVVVVNIGTRGLSLCREYYAVVPFLHAADDQVKFVNVDCLQIPDYETPGKEYLGKILDKDYRIPTTFFFVRGQLVETIVGYGSHTKRELRSAIARGQSATTGAPFRNEPIVINA
ncbi:MAG: hypothetical protein Greene041662_391 [Candidatus Peregrinibacteria bacterium Greene0416_62]|nr:MAG: hypothetical protein Greene041662_391 [Candidatus Peregrinibacteria bacterium Greene0416_62]TSC99544.1 MAG: hypothetical protein Greene101449_610 [Candidatus Peregrinibacteria bacterium Greene1014_49]